MASAAPEIPSLARDRAFETLYRRYVKDVYHYALALLRNPADAEDVTQTTFMNAYRAYKRGEEPLKPQNWLIKIAHNAARTRYARASTRVKEVPLEDHVETLSLPEEERPNVEGVLKALGRLPLNQRAALVMRELEGRSYAEIAETLDVSVSAVETLIFRGRRSLRLKSSALRALGAVQLPASLTEFFQGGGGAVAGGAAVGSGLLAKAAVALIAGAVATGIAGDHIRSASASNDALRPVSSPPWASLGTLQSRGLQVSFAPPRRSATVGRRTPRGARLAGFTSHRTLRRDEDVRGATARSSSTVEAGHSSSSSSAQAPTSMTASRPVTTAPVTDAVASVASAVPPSPVSVPSLPPVPPVQLPPAPVQLPRPPSLP